MNLSFKKIKFKWTQSVPAYSQHEYFRFDIYYFKKSVVKSNGRSGSEYARLRCLRREFLDQVGNFFSDRC